MPKTYRIAELETALENLVAMAEPAELHLKGRRPFKSRELEELSAAITAAKKVLKEE